MNRAGALAAMLLLLGSTALRAQTPPAGAPAGPPPAGPVAPAPPATPVPAPGMRIVTGQAAVVGGNSAAARERAFDDAIKRAVETAATDLVDPATRAAQAKTLKTILARARSFVPRYRTLEEGEVNGLYTVRLEAEVDEAALHAKLDRSGPQSPVTAAPRAGAQPLVLIASDKTEASVALAAALAVAIGATGVRARAGETAAAGEIPARVTAEIIDEGPLRGTGRSSVLCRGVARTGSPPAVPATELAASERVFVPSGERPEAQRAECAARLAASLAGRVGAAAASAGASGGGGGDLRAVSVQADVVEPAAVSALLRALRSVGAVSAVELTRVAGGVADLRVRTRAPAGAVASALSRDAGSVITLSDVEVSGDVIHLRARMRAVPAAAGGPAGGSPP